MYHPRGTNVVAGQTGNSWLWNVLYRFWARNVTSVLLVVSGAGYRASDETSSHVEPLSGGLRGGGSALDTRDILLFE